MLKNYFKTAWRNLQRNKIYSLINIAGLSLGLASAMLIMLYVKDDVSFDRFHKNVSHIYRVVSKSKHNGTEQKNSITGFLQGPRFTQNVPGIQSFVRLQSSALDIKTGMEVHSQSLLYVDSNFFSVFTLPLLNGNLKTCLLEPHSIVLSENMAEKQFGTHNAVGKIVMMKEDSAFVPYKVTAVAKTCPQNSTIKFDVLLPFRETTKDAKNDDNWFNKFLNTFVVLNPNANVQTVENQMQRFYAKDGKPTFDALIKKYGGGPDVQMGTYFLQPFTDIHLNPQLPPVNGLTDGSNPIFAYILSGIALFVLLIACINFVNLTVARSLKRAKEIGVRKVVGGGKKQLIAQFLGESFLLTIAAFTAAIILVKLTLPVFNDLSHKALSFSYLFDTRLVVGYLVLLIATGLLAGFYPALVLSGYKPTETLYSRVQFSGKNYLQKSLVVLQFALASFLIFATIVIYKQFNFLTKTDLGYDDNNIVVIHKNMMKHSEAALFKTALLQNPNIVEVAAKNGGYNGTTAKLRNDSSINFTYETIDESYIPALKIPLVAGRNFSKDFPADSIQSVLVNEAFVKKAGWKTPIGETVNFFYNNNEIYRVIGVVKDYHYQGLGQQIDPQLFTMKNSNLYGLINIKIKPNTAAECLKFIQKKFAEIFPLSPYSYVFKNEENLRSYETEARWKQIMLFGAILTIFISCIGLFGLSVLAAEKRTKEIGIRKILGASVNSVVATLSKDFLKLVCIALLVAVPAAWMVANKWLQNYPYRITIGWQIFAAAGFLVILIALTTVSFQAIKAAVANPVKSLRTE
ncbi:putative ABC transport system permease protein [Hydrobacter penzbergensis]|uniref:Putative ABC transport system permease protein n=1 Tax=Hydrobacter penzbergensis TaxID=1235997 RepID=A0A8X8IDN0_9BACT|nr:ABC transporter permease [Hydrobacter penzbergensis]SDW17497.1 putative ABC transport system permease protein [Hydrobacter penzbergensis]